MRKEAPSDWLPSICRAEGERREEKGNRHVAVHVVKVDVFLTSYSVTLSSPLETPCSVQ